MVPLPVLKHVLTSQKCHFLCSMPPLPQFISFKFSYEFCFCTTTDPRIIYLKGLVAFVCQYEPKKPCTLSMTGPFWPNKPKKWHFYSRFRASKQIFWGIDFECSFNHYYWSSEYPINRAGSIFLSIWIRKTMHSHQKKALCSFMALVAHDPPIFWYF